MLENQQGDMNKKAGIWDHFCNRGGQHKVYWWILE